MYANRTTRDPRLCRLPSTTSSPWPLTLATPVMMGAVADVLEEMEELNPDDVALVVALLRLVEDAEAEIVALAELETEEEEELEEGAAVVVLDVVVVLDSTHSEVLGLTRVEVDGSTHSDVEDCAGLSPSPSNHQLMLIMPSPPNRLKS